MISVIVVLEAFIGRVEHIDGVVVLTVLAVAGLALYVFVFSKKTQK